MDKCGGGDWRRKERRNGVGGGKKREKEWKERKRKGKLGTKVKSMLAYAYCRVILIVQFSFWKDFYAVKCGRKCSFISFCWE